MKFCQLLVGMVVPVVFSSTVFAADQKVDALKVVTKAFSCELQRGKAKSVVKALKTLGAVRDKNDEDVKFDFSEPISVFGLPVKSVTVLLENGDDPEGYVSVFSANFKDVAKAAGLKATHGPENEMGSYGLPGDKKLVYLRPEKAGTGFVCIPN